MFLRELLNIKRNNETLKNGSFKLIDLGENIFAYERVLGESYLVVCNFLDKEQKIMNISGKIILNNYDKFSGILKPYQALLIKRG